MTLIASYRSATTGFLGISDILVSRNTQDEPTPVHLPFRTNPLAHRHMNHILSGYSQKAVSFGRTLVLWAGYAAVAAAIIAEIVKESKNGENHVDIRSIIESLDLHDTELSETSIIY